MAWCACFGGEFKEQRREQERLASAEARARAAEAAQKRHSFLRFICSMFTISSSVLVIDNPKLGLIFVAIVDELCLCNRMAISGSRIISLPIVELLI